MGGLGSGSYYRFGGSKDRVEDCLALDVRSWWRDGWLKSGTGFTTTWWRRDRKESSIGVRVHGEAGAERDRAVELSYSRGPEGHKEDVSYAVPLSWTPCNFGGSRPWFVCPGVLEGVSCGRRVAKLYLKANTYTGRAMLELEEQFKQEGAEPTHRGEYGAGGYED